MSNGVLWCDNNYDSEMSIMLREAKQKNDENFWSTLRTVLDHDLNTLPKMHFRTWASVLIVPLVNNSRMHKPIVDTIAYAFEDDNVKHALTEDWIGVPDNIRAAYRIFDDSEYSAHRCYNMNHILNYDMYNDMDDIRSYDTIVEIGGGYGDMCAVIHKLGFKGKYYIFDFPEMHKLQKYFLTESGISNVNYITDFNELPTDVTLTIGTWSLSEIPLDLRNNIIDKLWNSEHWLITYQNRIFGNNNDQYFIEKFKEKDCAIDPIEYMPFDGGNNYLIV